MWIDRPILRVADGLEGVSKALTAGITMLDRHLTKYYDLLEPVLRIEPPPAPGKVKVVVVSQVPVSSQGVVMLKFKCVMPAFSASDPNDNDVSVRKLSVTIGSGEPILLDVAPNFSADPALSDVNDDRFKGEDGTVVSVLLNDVDKKGNVGPATPSSFTLSDNIAPPAPGSAAVVVVSQVEADAPPAEEPAEEPGE